MNLSRPLAMTLAFALTASASMLHAKPIAFAGGTTVMVEHGGPTMDELQGFYAPAHWWSWGAGALRLDAADGSFRHELAYGRVNLLAKRWNLPGAQGNAFVWGGLGKAEGSDFAGSLTATNAGFQFDYETRRVYGSIKADLYETDAFSHRIDTLQLGAAPYLHDWDRMATWVVLQARSISGGVDSGVEGALVLRLFKGGTWVELGVTDAGDLQVMAMFNF
jgi:hypothetical protein